MPQQPKKESKIKIFIFIILGAVIGEFIALGIALWLM